MKETKVTLTHKLNYILITLAAGVAGEFVWSIAIGAINSLVKEKPSDAAVLAVNAIFVILIALATALVIGFLTKGQVEQQYYETNSQKAWFYSFIDHCLIGAIVKFVICMIPINTMRFGSYLNRIFRILYDNFYLTGRNNYQLFLEGEYIPTDFVVYFFVQLLSLVILLPLIALTYRYHWQKADKEHRELVRYQRKD